LNLCLSLISDLIGVARNEEEDVFIWGDYHYFYYFAISQMTFNNWRN
jgi:hypothetical protein